MLKTLALAGALLCALTINADARKLHRAVIIASDECNRPGPNAAPCEGVAPSPRGERVVKAMGGFGSAQKIYTPGATPSLSPSAPAIVVGHPAGCPARAFCGCGAAVRVFGSPVRSLWLAANWFRFPRTSPAPGTVAVRAHHVMVLEADLGGGVWQVYDANSGGHATRVHARSIAGYVIVNPRGRTAIPQARAPLAAFAPDKAAG